MARRLWQRLWSTDFPLCIPQPEAVAFLQHSSGTTGLQKGVALSHQAVLNQLQSYSQALALSASDVVVSWLPLYHDMGLIAGFLLPLVQGIPLVLMSPFDWVKHPALLLRAIDRYEGTLCWLPNFAYNHCARRVRPSQIEGISLASMRLFVNCSEPVRHDSHEQFLKRFAPYGLQPEMLAVSYAMAENTFAVTQTPPGQSPQLDVVQRDILQMENRAVPISPEATEAVTVVSCGPAIAGTRVGVVDANGRFLPERQVGELVIRSNCMLTGYYGRPDLNPFREGWYYTGDRGYMVAGEVYVNGRDKDLIIHAGKNIYPQDIEASLNVLPGLHPGRVVVFGVFDSREGTEQIVVVAECAEPDVSQPLKDSIRQVVGSYHQVTAGYVTLVPRGWLVKTSSGKLARGANRERWLQANAPC